MQPTIKAVTKPIIAGRNPMDSEPASPLMSLMTVSNASPRMGMMTMRNENLATWSRLLPRIIPVAIVEPERLRPGSTAMAWAQPMIKASR